MMILHKQSGMADIKHEFDPLNCVWCHRYEMLRLKLKEEKNMSMAVGYDMGQELEKAQSRPKFNLYKCHVVTTLENDFDAGCDIWVVAEDEEQARHLAWKEEASAVGSNEEGENFDPRRETAVGSVMLVELRDVQVVAKYVGLATHDVMLVLTSNNRKIRRVKECRDLNCVGTYPHNAH